MLGFPVVFDVVKVYNILYRLNRLRTGVGRFGANTLPRGLSKSDSCDGGAEQMADHSGFAFCCIVYLSCHLDFTGGRNLGKM